VFSPTGLLLKIAGENTQLWLGGLKTGQVIREIAFKKSEPPQTCSGVSK